MILQKARCEKLDGLFISKDILPEMLAKREPQLATLRESKRAGKVAYFLLDRLVVRDRTSTQSKQA